MYSLHFCDPSYYMYYVISMNFFQKFFQEQYQDGTEGIDSVQDVHFVIPYLSPHCLHRFLADLRSCC